MAWPITGGSVLVKWDVVDGETAGVVREFNTAQGVITQQLQTMYANGQRRLGIALPYYEGGSGFALDSHFGYMSVQDRQNFRNLLSTIKGMGFEHVLLEMIPEWSAEYTNWTNTTVMGSQGTRAWSPLSYSRNFSYTYDVWGELASSGIPQYAIDLHAEAIPPGTPDPITLKYLNRFWDDWCCLVGPAGTVGFSFVPTVDRMGNLGKVYSNGAMPYIWAPHVYGASGSWTSTAQTWAGTKSTLDSLGLGGRGYIVGETYTNDGECASVFQGDGSIFWILQWPVGRDTPENVTQDRIPLDYGNYAAAGL